MIMMIMIMNKYMILMIVTTIIITITTMIKIMTIIMIMLLMIMNRKRERGWDASVRQTWWRFRALFAPSWRRKVVHPVNFGRPAARRRGVHTRSGARGVCKRFATRWCLQVRC